ncbi:MAG: hypothetical protein K9K86_11930 [Pseudomonadales bacterium]|nr:hypothetical protein [Pseudomonadales bacterium]
MSGFIHDVFQNFNPLNPLFPQELPFHCGPIAQRARWIVQGRTINELNALVDGLNQMLFLTRQKTPITLIEKFRDTDNKEPEGIYYTETQALRMHYEEFVINDNPDVKNASWADYFATLALSNLGHLVNSIRDEAMPKEQAQDEFDNLAQAHLSHHNLENFANMPIEAMEALCYAEEFIREGTPKKSLQLRGEKISQSKLRTYHALKQEMVRLYNASFRHLSDNKAAREIHQALSEELKYTSASEDLHKQIAIWIGQYKRKSIAGYEQLTPYEA